MESKDNINSVKRHIFFEFLNLVGRVFILVRHSENVVLGKRGFTAEEREKGIVLVFNTQMNALWDEHGITSTLVFGNAPQKCFIPADDIIAVYSPELDAQFVVSPQTALTPGCMPGLALPSQAGHQCQGKGNVRREGMVHTAQGVGATGKDKTKGTGQRGGKAPGASKNIVRVDFAKRKKVIE